MHLSESVYIYIFHFVYDTECDGKLSKTENKNLEKQFFCLFDAMSYCQIVLK